VRREDGEAVPARGGDAEEDEPVVIDMAEAG